MFCISYFPTCSAEVVECKDRRVGVVYLWVLWWFGTGVCQKQVAGHRAQVMGHIRTAVWSHQHMGHPVQVIMETFSVSEQIKMWFSLLCAPALRCLAGLLWLCTHCLSAWDSRVLRFGATVEPQQKGLSVISYLNVVRCPSRCAWRQVVSAKLSHTSEPLIFKITQRLETHFS